MTCERCGSSNPEGQKYCGACGAPLDALAQQTQAAIESAVRSEVSKALAGYVKDQRIAELDVTENVTNRLVGWGKLIGIILGVFLAGAGYLGFKSLRDVVDSVESEVQPLVANAKKNVDTLTKQLAKNTDDLNKQIADAERDFAGLHEQITDAKHDVAELHDEKAKLTADFAQMEKEAGPIHQQIAKLQADSKAQTSTVDQLKSQVSQLDTRIRELPTPTGAAPYHLRLEDVVPRSEAAPSTRGGRSLVFHATGDTGGVQNPVFQEKVANALTAEFNTPDAAKKPAFLYLLGDLIYYNGEQKEYYSQFYHPYQHYPAPIFAIAGNHDAENLSPETSLAGFMANFCAASAVQRPEAGGLSRTAMIQPNVYWTLQTDLATIVGLYTNVPDGGAIADDQQDWLVQELKSAPMDKALIIALHHPPFSFGVLASSRMRSVIEDAINRSRRVPNMVLSAHANNYQRIDVELRPKLVVPFFVVGTGGYHNLRMLDQSARGAGAGPKSPRLLKNGRATLVRGFDDRWGFVRFEVTDSEIKGRFMALGRDLPDAAAPADEFTYSAKPLVLGDGQTVSLSESGQAARQ